MNSPGSKYYHHKNILLVVASVIFILIQTAAYAVMYHYTFAGLRRFRDFERGHIAILVIYAVILLILLLLFSALKVGYMRNIDVLYSQAISICIVNAVSYLILLLIGKKSFLDMTYLGPVLILTVTQLAICIIWTMCTRFFYARVYPAYQILLIYGDIDPEPLERKVHSRFDRYQVRERISLNVGMAEIQHRIHDYDTVLIADIPSHERNHIMKYCYWHEIRCYCLPKVSDIMIQAADRIDLFDTPLLLTRNVGLSLPQSIIKRCFDILSSLIAIIITSPIMLVIAVAIKLEDRGKVIYSQKRLTKDSREFDIYKFRSMKMDSEGDKARLLASDDDRVTKVGRVIRRLHFDELPQLFNILKGDMSMVGPRPERADICAKYTETIPEFPFRLKMKAGLTGYAQVYGKYNTTPYDKLKLDLIYIENYNFWLDIKICVFTVKILFQKEKSEGVEAGQTTALSADSMYNCFPYSESYYDR